MDSLLLIEDNDEEAAMVALSLSSYEVHRARSLAEGLEMAERLQPAVILMDLGLPDAQDGDGLVQLGLVAPFSPVTVITGCDDHDVLVSCLDMGARAIVRKPARGAELLLQLEVARHAIMPASNIKTVLDEVRGWAAQSVA